MRTPAESGRAGISMGLLSAEELDVPLDFESLRKPGCLGLGTAAVTVIDDQTSIVDYLYNTCRFFAHESCGQCTPCREGTNWYHKTMSRIKSGGGRLEDIDIMLELANSMGIMPGTTICGLADGAAWPIKNAVAKFRPELEDYIRTHQSGDRKVKPLQEKIAHGMSAVADSSMVQLAIGPGSTADGAAGRPRAPSTRA
jgi:NADH-quinone oxidoreductase subunit F